KAKFVWLCECFLSLLSFSTVFRPGSLLFSVPSISDPSIFCCCEDPRLSHVLAPLQTGVTSPSNFSGVLVGHMTSFLKRRNVSFCCQFFAKSSISAVHTLSPSWLGIKRSCSRSISNNLTILFGIPL